MKLFLKALSSHNICLVNVSVTFAKACEWLHFQTQINNKHLLHQELSFTRLFSCSIHNQVINALYSHKDTLKVVRLDIQGFF